MNIAVTGTIGSGKSRVVSLMGGLLQVDPVDADAICRELLEPGAPGWRQVRSLWGERFLNPDGAIDRVALRKGVFGSPQIRRGLEDILHPLVRERIAVRLEDGKASDAWLLAEIPLLYEVGWAEAFDLVVAVYTPAAVSIQRTALRDAVAASQVEAILSLQMVPEEKAGRADYVIDNSSTWSSTVVQTMAFVRKLQRFELQYESGLYVS